MTETRTETITVVDGLPLRLSFEPQAIREHFGVDGDEPPDYTAFYSADDARAASITLGATDDELATAGAAALADDRIYRAFHEALMDALLYGEQR